MKVNFNNTQNYVYAYKLMVGSTFTAKEVVLMKSVYT